MTHDERISSYIDNELSVEQEQEFLISLAASDGLRKSFRSELVLKKVLHHDEAATNPPRRLRAAVFTTLGLGGAGLGANAVNANNANAASSIAARGLVKSLFATKMSTLVTVAGISASALAGYGVRSITAPIPASKTSHVERVVHHSPVVSAPVMISPATVPSTPVVSNEQSPANIHSVNHHASTSKHPSVVASKNENVSGASGTGSIKMEPPKINGQH